MAITTIEDLRAHVALATKVELSTIPPYLYALYSIKDQQSEAARLIASVVVEEMLHVCLTTNLLLAIGGEPDFSEGVVPVYPGLLAHHKPDLTLELRPCTIDLVRDIFMAIERPQLPGAVPEDDDFETLGQFYAALETGMDDIGRAHLFANHQPQRQLTDPSFYGPVAFDADDSGGLMLIHDRDSARAALEVIIHQGEGVGTERWADPDHLELTHYFKFEQIVAGTVHLGPVWPMLHSPRTADLPPHLRGASDLFNAIYALVFLTMQGLFSAAVDQGVLISRLYTLMSHCLAPTAQYLAAQPVGGARTAGPTFEFYSFGADPWDEAMRLGRSVCAEHPPLADIAERVAVLAAESRGR